MRCQHLKYQHYVQTVANQINKEMQINQMSKEQRPC